MGSPKQPESPAGLEAFICANAASVSGSCGGVAGVLVGTTWSRGGEVVGEEGEGEGGERERIRSRDKGTLLTLLLVGCDLI